MIANKYQGISDLSWIKMIIGTVALVVMWPQGAITQAVGPVVTLSSQAILPYRIPQSSPLYIYIGMT
jgi:hypothetical protein